MKAFRYGKGVTTKILNQFSGLAKLPKHVLHLHHVFWSIHRAWFRPGLKLFVTQNSFLMGLKRYDFSCLSLMERFSTPSLKFGSALDQEQPSTGACRQKWMASPATLVCCAYQAAVFDCTCPELACNEVERLHFIHSFIPRRVRILQMRIIMQRSLILLNILVQPHWPQRKLKNKTSIRKLRNSVFSYGTSSLHSGISWKSSCD